MVATTLTVRERHQPPELKNLKLPALMLIRTLQTTPLPRGLAELAATTKLPTVPKHPVQM